MCLETEWGKLLPDGLVVAFFFLPVLFPVYLFSVNGDSGHRCIFVFDIWKRTTLNLGQQTSELAESRT